MGENPPVCVAGDFPDFSQGISTWGPAQTGGTVQGHEAKPGWAGGRGWGHALLRGLCYLSVNGEAVTG